MYFLFNLINILFVDSNEISSQVSSNNLSYRNSVDFAVQDLKPHCEI